MATSGEGEGRAAVSSTDVRFRETAVARIWRWTWSVIHALSPSRIYHRKEGLAAISEDLRPETVLNGYRRGMFPVRAMGPTKWYSPAQRAVLFFENTQIDTEAREAIRQERFDVTFDHDFAAVMKACSVAGRSPELMSPRLLEAFWRLHEAGYAHSVEVWDYRQPRAADAFGVDVEPRLIGGIFGVAVGRVFFTEGRFSIAAKGAEIASAALDCHLANWGYVLRAAKWMSPALAESGFVSVPRSAFMDLLRQHAGEPPTSLAPWEIDESLAVARWEPAASLPQGPFGRQRS